MGGSLRLVGSAKHAIVDSERGPGRSDRDFLGSETNVGLRCRMIWIVRVIAGSGKLIQDGRLAVWVLS